MFAAKERTTSRLDSTVKPVYNILCDSADLFSWFFKKVGKSKRVPAENGFFREIELAHVILRFVHQYSTPEAFADMSKSILAHTAGTPDYIITNAEGTVILCIEDTHTAPVGNAVLQRLDKLFPLWLNAAIECPVKFIGPLEGVDKSQDKTRSWEQSWFYKCWAKSRPDIFRLLDNAESIMPEVYREILQAIEMDALGTPLVATSLTGAEIETLHATALRHIRSYEVSNGSATFRGKLYKPDNSPAHPVQSTLMTICELRRALKMSPIKIETTHGKRLQSSTSRRILRIMATNPILAEGA